VLADELARRVARRTAEELAGERSDWAGRLAPSDVTFVSARAGDSSDALMPELPGIVVTTLAPAQRLE
jgi:hypothetical protein